MEKLLLHHTKTIQFINVCLLIFFMAVSMLAVQNALASQQYEEWQKQRLLNPNKHQLKKDRQGYIFIYDGMSEQDIERAMDRAFGRIDSMMFINIKTKTKRNSGNTPATGNDESDSDDDDC